MIDISKGRYWDFGWQLIDGCTPCSPGCDNCWSASMTHRFNFQWTDKGRFNGKITVHPEKLNIPLKRKKPAVYAIWNDLFHKDVSEGFKEDVFDIISESCDRHSFLILTKRPERMAEFLDWDPWIESQWPNVYLGLTVCNQQEADEKIPVFLKVPGKKFLSLEPLLEEINLHLLDDYDPIGGLRTTGNMIDGIILGGETGPKAKPMHPDWVRSVRNQCQAAGVPFFFKSWGEFVESTPSDEESAKSHIVEHDTSFYRIGRKAAGRILDGVTHDDLPWVK